MNHKRRAAARKRSRCAAQSCQRFFDLPGTPIVGRSAATTPGFRGISSLAALTPVFHDPAPRRSRSHLISVAGRQRKRLIEEGMTTMTERENIDQVGEYQVPVDPMDDLQCESCQ